MQSLLRLLLAKNGATFMRTKHYRRIPGFRFETPESLEMYAATFIILNSTTLY